MSEQTKRASTSPVETYSDPGRAHLAVHVDTTPELQPLVRVALASTARSASHAASGGNQWGSAQVATLPPSGLHQLRDLIDEALGDRPSVPSTTTVAEHLHQLVTGAGSVQYDAWPPAVVEPVEGVEVATLEEYESLLSPEQNARASALHQAAAVTDREGIPWLRHKPAELLHVARWIVNGDPLPTEVERAEEEKAADR